MSDFERLPEDQKTLLRIKLDGHVEACIHAARQMNIGLAEAVDLAAMAFLRELCARGFDRAATAAILDDAVNRAYPQPVPERTMRVS